MDSFIHKQPKKSKNTILTRQSRDTVKLTDGKSHIVSVWRGCGVCMAESPHFTCGGLQRAGLGQPFPIYS